ncbi:hypothetical protein [Minwuia sp.]|uniref:hypothetical protein n=1 Tax=Minwuia sp. TaxID=2493630 RepID=UPI003A8FE74C
MTAKGEENDKDPSIRNALERSYDWIVERDRLISLWAKASSWSLEEGIALAYNKDPDKAIRTVDSAFGDTALIVPDPGRHHLKLAIRAYQDGLLTMPIKPTEFIAWAENVGLKFDDSWHEAVSPAASVAEPYSPKDNTLSGVGDGEAASSQPSDQVHQDNEEINPKVKASLLRLVIGMAVGAYAYDPADTRSDVTREIADDLDRAGVSLKRDTILKWLREGAELLPRDLPDDAGSS